MPDITIDLLELSEISDEWITESNIDLKLNQYILYPYTRISFQELKNISNFDDFLFLVRRKYNWFFKHNKNSWISIYQNNQNKIVDYKSNLDFKKEDILAIYNIFSELIYLDSSRGYPFNAINTSNNAAYNLIGKKNKNLKKRTRKILNFFHLFFPIDPANNSLPDLTFEYTKTYTQLSFRSIWAYNFIHYLRQENTLDAWVERNVTCLFCNLTPQFLERQRLEEILNSEGTAFDNPYLELDTSNIQFFIENQVANTNIVNTDLVFNVEELNSFKKLLKILIIKSVNAKDPLSPNRPDVNIDPFRHYAFNTLIEENISIIYLERRTLEGILKIGIEGPNRNRRNYIDELTNKLEKFKLFLTIFGSSIETFKTNFITTNGNNSEIRLFKFINFSKLGTKFLAGISLEDSKFDLVQVPGFFTNSINSINSDIINVLQTSIIEEELEQTAQLTFAIEQEPLSQPPSINYAQPLEPANIDLIYNILGRINYSSPSIWSIQRTRNRGE